MRVCSTVLLIHYRGTVGKQDGNDNKCLCSNYLRGHRPIQVNWVKCDPTAQTYQRGCTYITISQPLHTVGTHTHTYIYIHTYPECLAMHIYLSPKGWDLCIVYACEDFFQVGRHHHKSFDAFF